MSWTLEVGTLERGWEGRGGIGFPGKRERRDDRWKPPSFARCALPPSLPLSVLLTDDDETYFGFGWALGGERVSECVTRKGDRLRRVRWRREGRAPPPSASARARALRSAGLARAPAKGD